MVKLRLPAIRPYVALQGAGGFLLSVAGFTVNAGLGFGIAGGLSLLAGIAAERGKD
jgi:hypothetical protein